MEQAGLADCTGTEPAGDIFYARYERVTLPDGTVEQNLLGPDNNAKLTKELQDQVRATPHPRPPARPCALRLERHWHHLREPPSRWIMCCAVAEGWLCSFRCRARRSTCR
jgi:hypothetical protein